jgi:hypothetical protein
VNYRKYYFVAISYAYNNFRQFTYEKADSSQQTPYLESSHGANGRNIAVYDPMPNPANGDFGTVVNSDYGSGVIIKRMEGSGNGGRETSFDDATEQQALVGPDYQAVNPVYTAGLGPVGVKVIDPRLVKPLDWELFIQGPVNADPSKGIVAESGSWMLISSNRDTIISEKNISSINEQILANYGLSVTIHQVGRPGDESSVDRNGYINSTISYRDPSRAWLGGVPDAEQINPQNWIRSGKYLATEGASPCSYNDKGILKGRDQNPDSNQNFERMLSQSTPNTGTWAPAALAVIENSGDCGFGVVNLRMQSSDLQTLNGVDIVFTNDQTKWTKAVVLELQDATSLAEGGVAKFMPRKHQSWNKAVDDLGRPVYSTDPGDTGFSWFPGYAIDQETGIRVNIVFGEDSYLKAYGGNDMIWNPVNTILDPTTSNVIFGGKHYVYVTNSKYDGGASWMKGIEDIDQGVPPTFFNTVQWVGLPTLLGNAKLLPLNEGLIPTETRIRLRVSRPYANYVADPAQTLRNNGFPLYGFSTKSLAPKSLEDSDNKWHNDKQALLDQIMVSPNPYYGATGYENNRLDTRVRIINLPRKATIRIYSTDGTLIRTLTKDNPNQSYVDWDTRNAKGLAIASGMYLVHVNADGIGETIIRWFGAMRPVDITTY